MALRIISLVVGLIIAIPFIALNVWGFKMSMWVNDFTTQNEAIINGDAPPSSLPSMPVNPLSWIQNRAALRDTYSTTEITRRRTINISEVLPFEELLSPGEAMPDEEHYELYAEARAPARLMPYCAEILATIASSCDVTHTSARENRTGKYQLSGRLAFTPRTDLGDPSTVENGDLFTTAVSLPVEGDLAPPNDRASREALLNQAQSYCDVLRDQLGNCVLVNVDFTIDELWITDLEALPAGTNPQRLNVRAGYAVYADETVLDRRAFRDMVNELVNPT